MRYIDEIPKFQFRLEILTTQERELRGGRKVVWIKKVWTWLLK